MHENKTMISLELLKKYSAEAYLLLFPASYFLIYTNNSMYKIVNLLIIISSYYLIVVKRNFYPVIFLVLYSRCINGFVWQDSKTIYSLINLITGYLPTVVYICVMNKLLTYRKVKKIVFTKYSVTLLYILSLLIYSTIDIELSWQFFFPRVVPMIMFILIVCVFPEDIEIFKIIKFFRYISIASLAVFFLMNYVEISSSLLESGIVFSKQEEVYTIKMFGMPRNMGIFWDFRIFGIFTVVYLFSSLIQKDYTFRWFDILLSLFSLMTTLARGSMVVATILILAFITHERRFRLILAVFVLVAFLVISIISVAQYNDDVMKVVSSFNVLSKEENALSQRGGFVEYALEKFKENPLGGGIGSLKATGPDRSITVGEASYSNASDAFLAIQLAEVGIFSFILFVGSFFEILWYRSWLGLALVVGFFIQMTGTDIPDMGVFYFMVLVMLTMLMKKALQCDLTDSKGRM